MRKTLAAVTGLSLLAFGLTTVTAAGATAGCAGRAAGGEWRSYGHDLANSRSQSARTAITPERAAALAPAWSFSVPDSGGVGEFNNTPVVADGCLYLATSGGTVFALNADTGQVAWKRQLEDPVQSTPTVTGGRIYLSVTKLASPYVVALDQRTGRLLWERVIDTQVGSDTYSSPAVFNGMVLVGISGTGAESGTTVCPDVGIPCDGGGAKRLGFRGSYAILDARTGALLHKDYVISDRDFRAGYAGGGIWSSAAVDPRSGYAYFGTGNPFSADEHPNTNAIVQIDVQRGRRTFGRVVGAVHGTTDLYIDGATSKPVCRLYVDVFTCDPPDYDFGASPQLFTTPDGRRVVGDHQKSGVYTVADARSMRRVWQAVVGGPFGQFGGGGTASFDGSSLYVLGSAPGQLNALDRAGAHRWVTPVGDGVHFQSVSTAGGVAYGTDSRGLLNVWETATGRLLTVRSLAADTNQPGFFGFSTGEGVAIARNTVYVPAGGVLTAYR